jgi:hypothetical protein
MNLAAGLAISMALISATLPAAGNTHVERYRVTQKGGGLGIGVDETVIFYLIEGRRGEDRWVAERRRRDRNWCGMRSTAGKCSATDVAIHDWIDGDKCPGLRAALTALSKIDLVGFAPPDRLNSTTVSDTPETIVTAASAIAGIDSKVTLSQYDGPVVDWWRKTEDQLSHCWQRDAVAASGSRTDPQLAAGF